MPTPPRRNGQEPSDHLLRIDPNRLEDECAQYAARLYEVGLKLAMAVDKRDRAKRAAERAEAYAGLRIREHGARAEIKFTIPQVEEMVVTDSEVIAAHNRVDSCDSEIAGLEPLYEAMKRRASMLEYLVQLYIARYHGGRIEQRQERALDARIPPPPPRRPHPPQPVQRRT